ncbi:hypothetical protein ACET3Z_028160 [Daucus carota]
MWRPYAALDDEFQPDETLYLQWTAPTCLMYMAYVEWCYTDRVTRQFGFVQDIPTSSPRVIEALPDAEVSVLSHLLSRSLAHITLMWPVLAQLREAGRTMLAPLLRQIGMYLVLQGLGNGPEGDEYVGGEGDFAVNLEDDEDTSAAGGHTPFAPPLQESYQFLDRDAYHPDISFLEDQYTTPPLQAPVPSFGSPSYVFGAPAFPLTPAPVRSTPTPVHMHSFGSYAAESSPWVVRDESEPEGPSQPEQRQQPPRDAKGKGRRCHTGSHIFGHKKK